MTKKLLFLDIDGVLNSVRYWEASGRHLDLFTERSLDPTAIVRLNKIILQTGAKIILSSAWRGKGRSRSVEAMLRSRGFVHRFHGSTPYIPGPRCIEINTVLDQLQPERFVILDDDADAWTNMFLDRGGRFVNTNYVIGLQDDGVAMAVQWLNNDAPNRRGGCT